MHSLARIFPNGVELELHVQCKDGGGGGILKILMDKLKVKTMLHGHYLIASSTLQNFQTCLRLAVLNVLGYEGTDGTGGFQKILSR